MALKDTNLFFKYIKRCFTSAYFVNTLRLASSVSDGEVVTVNGVVFEFDTNSATTAGNIKVDVSGGATAAAAITALVAAVNANAPGVSCVAITGGISFYSSAAFAASTTMAGTNNAWAAATAYGGKATKSTPPRQVTLTRVPNATEVAVGSLQVVAPFTPLTVRVDVVVTSSGARTAWDGAFQISGGIVTIDNSGSTDWATTSTLQITLSE